MIKKAKAALKKHSTLVFFVSGIAIGVLLRSGIKIVK